LDEHVKIFHVRQLQNNKKKKKKKKKKKYTPGPQFKHGVQVPQNVEQAIKLDEANGNTAWQDAIEKEMSQLIRLKRFDFKPTNHNPGDDYQKPKLRLIFGVKQDLRRKARLVAGGHLVDVLDNHSYSSTVKGVSVKLLHAVAHQQDQNQLCGNVMNAFVQAYANEKVYAVAGLEFGLESVGKIVIIRKVLYGLVSSSERWHSHFADTLRGLNFVPTRSDADVWIRLDKDKKAYKYICTHVDDFMIVAKLPAAIMKDLQDIYTINEESII
jgi:hypothetical protein